MTQHKRPYVHTDEHVTNTVNSQHAVAPSADMTPKPTSLALSLALSQPSDDVLCIAVRAHGTQDFVITSRRHY